MSDDRKRTLEAIEDVRTTFLRATTELPEIPSFRSLLATSREIREPFERIVAGAGHPRIRSECDGGITCAMIGSSAHGKTTILDELFPDLAARGWLVTDVTDTTSQSLCIRHAPRDSATRDHVVVHSWSATQIKELMSQEEVREQNDNDSIKVAYHDDRVVVDGSMATFPQKELAAARFPRTLELRPFAEPYVVNGEQARDPGFIRALTVKEQSSVVRTEPIIRQGERSWNPLQLRAVVKDVSLCDGFERIANLSGRPIDELRQLTFIDTPGLATPGSSKDEVLRHFLEKKSTQIALQLWKDDELDIVIHLVLCGRSSDFAQLWKQIERTCEDPDLEGLEDRLVLAVNGMNRYFTDPNIKEKYEDPDAARRAGDQFASTLESNILQNMSPRGRVRPARIAFLDSESIVETLTGKRYREAYADYRPVMERWAEPGGPGYATLERLGIVESFRENIDALCDPDDRGQGFLMRELLSLIDERGPALLLRKVLARTDLLDLVRGTLDLLDRSYDQDGNLAREAIKEAMRSCLAFLDPQHLDTIEQFAVEELDEDLDQVVERLGRTGDEYPKDWIAQAWRRMTHVLLERIEQRAEAPAQVVQEFRRHYEARTAAWVERWGYSTAELTSPSKGYAQSKDLVTHCLKLHAREILHQLVAGDAASGNGEDAAATLAQSEEDRQRVVELRGELERILKVGHDECARHGVKP